MRSFLIILLSIFCFISKVDAQFILTPAFNPKITKAAYKDLSPRYITLPFIDDFSNYVNTPTEDYWENGGAYVNRDYPISPPSVGVVTLDAINSKGEIYSNANTTGFSADTLTSLSIRLDSIFYPQERKLSAKDSVYLSFYFQPGGGMGNVWENIGANPSKKDSLILQFYCSKDDTWRSVWRSEGFPLDSLYINEGVYFKQILIPITDTDYFNNDFRFRFRNFASLDNNPLYSYVGNCDHWHIDYIYLDINRSFTDSTRKDIAFVEPARSLLKTYQAVPARQFSISYMKEYLDIAIVNLSNTTLNSVYKYNILDQNSNSVHEYFGGYENISPFIQTKEFQTAPSHASPVVSYVFDVSSDRWTYYDIIHTLKEGVGTDDNQANDTIKFRQHFENYFAYDDATAENGFGVEAIKNPSIAVEFSLIERDTLSAVDIYFNSSLNRENLKPFYISIWNEENGYPKDSIFRSSLFDSISIEQVNKYARFILDRSVVLEKGKFFVCLESKGSNYMNIGFDRNTDASKYIFGNWGNGWESPFIKGSLMLRPYFGYKAAVSIDKIEKEEIKFNIYPNPTASMLNIDAKGFDYEIRITNMMGQIVYKSNFKPQVNLSNLNDGIYILTLIDKKTYQSKQKKIIIQK